MKRNNPPRFSAGPSQGNDLIKQDLQQFMQAKKQRSSESCTIFRVREREKEVKPQHFQHELISLGLYDRSRNDWGTPIAKPKVAPDTPKPKADPDTSKSKVDSGTPKQKGDEFRLEIVTALLKELGKTVADWDDICTNVVKDPQQMRNLYDEHGDLLPVPAVSSALTLDAIFLVCCLGTCYNEAFASTFKSVFKVFMSKSNTFRKMLFLDIIKLENQIPLSLLQDALQFLIDHKPGPDPIQVTRPPTSQTRRVFRAIHRMLTRADKKHDEERGNGVRLERRQQSEHIGRNGRGEGTNDDEGEETHSIIHDQLDGKRILHSICTGLADNYKCSLPFTVYSEKDDEKSPVYENCNHLLDCLYTATFVDSNKEPRQSDVHDEPTRDDDGLHAVRMRHNKDWNQRNKETTTLSSIGETSAVDNQVPLLPPVPRQAALPSATQLHEAGIECRGHSGAFKKPEFRVYAYKATLYLPIITYMKTHSEPLWRNLVAYEDEKSRPGDDAFASYLEVMDQLIDTERDVSLLRTGKNPVIVSHGLGSEQAVAEVFNSILSNYDVDLKTYHQWSDLCNNICDYYYKNKAKQKFVKFARAYLNEPWLIFSILAALALLVLTLLQTVFSILSYFHRRDK